MGATGFETGIEGLSFWYKNFDEENWVTLGFDKDPLDEGAKAEIQVIEYNENKFSTTAEHKNKALAQAVLEVLSNHGKELFDKYKQILRINSNHYSEEYRNKRHAGSCPKCKRTTRVTCTECGRINFIKMDGLLKVCELCNTRLLVKPIEGN